MGPLPTLLHTKAGGMDHLGPFELGRVHRGDVLLAAEHLPEASVDAVIADPPYSSGGAFRGDRTLSTVAKYVQSGQRSTPREFLGDTRDAQAYRLWVAMWTAQLFPIVRLGGHLLVFTDWRQLPVTIEAVQMGGFVYRGVIPWDKTAASRPRSGFSARCEFVVWATQGPFTAPVYLQGLVTVPVVSDGGDHIAQKPVEVIEHLVAAVPPTGVVLDPFAGAATVGIACKKMDRRYLGFELDPAWVHIGNRRLGMTASEVGLPLFVAS